MRPHAWVHCAALGAACVTASTAAAATASFTGLGGLGGSPYPDFLSDALSVSADGRTVVGFGATAAGVQPFRWTAAGGPVVMEDVPGSIVEASAWDVSADGTVIVGKGTDALTEVAVRWTDATGAVSLGTLPGGVMSNGRGVSGDGAVAVGETFAPPLEPHGALRSQAFRWTQATGMVGIGDLPGGQESATAYAASFDGAVIVGSSSSVNGGEAYRWTQATGMVGLGDLPGGAFRSWASDVSADGNVIVGTAHSPEGPQSFRWTAADGMVGLGEVPGGLFGSEAKSVSADGSVVVGNGYGEAGYEAFIWDADHGMRKLADVLAGAGVDLTGWTLAVATGVSGDGTVVVGTGTHNGVTEAFVVVVPEPSGVVMLGLGALCLRRRRRLG